MESRLATTAALAPAPQPSAFQTRRSCGCYVTVTAATIFWVCAQGCGDGYDSRRTGGSPAPARDASGPSSGAPLALGDVILGVMPRSGRREFIARLTNPTNRTVRWSALRTSCDCVSVIASKSVLKPRDDMLARISFDRGERRDFVGNLAVEVTACSETGADILRFNILAEVVSEDELAFCDEVRR